MMFQISFCLIHSMFLKKPTIIPVLNRGQNLKNIYSINKMDAITYDDFKKLDLRVAKILEAQRVEGSDKLVRLQIEVGELGERQLVAGIGTVYEPAILIGKQIVIVANLEPRKLMGHESQGMLLAASDELGPVLLAPESEVKEGTPIK